MRSSLARLAAFLLLFPSLACAQASIRFGVLSLFHPRTLQLAWTGPGALVVSAPDYSIVLNGEPAHRRLLLQALDGRVLLAGHVTDRIIVSGRGADTPAYELIVPGRFRRLYQGQLEIMARGNELIPVVRMPIETAVATIVASEMPRDTPAEALKAQAVVTRSFLVAGPRHHDFDFCDTTHCQYMRSPAEVSDRVWRAVRATQGIILTWSDRPIAALYSSRCGGATRSLRQAGIDPGEGYPYYSVDCPWCRAHPLQQSRRPAAAHRAWGALPAADSHKDPPSQQNRQAAIGHGIGMCQHGAAGMALAGANFQSILAHYYPNAELKTTR